MAVLDEQGRDEWVRYTGFQSSGGSSSLTVIAPPYELPGTESRGLSSSVFGVEKAALRRRI
jgi:hypothetical protein